MASNREAEQHTLPQNLGDAAQAHVDYAKTIVNRYDSGVARCLRAAPQEELAANACTAALRPKSGAQTLKTADIRRRGEEVTCDEKHDYIG